MIGLLNELTLKLNGLTLSPRRSSLTITRSRQIKHDRKSFTIIAAGAFRGQSTGGKGISRRAISPLEIGRIGSCASAPFQAVHIFNSKIDMTALTTFTKSSKRSASVTAAAPNALVDTEMKSNSVENGDNAVNGTSLDNAKILSEVRRHLKEMEIDAIIVPSADPHQSEYTALCYGRRSFVSGFTGSAGTAVVMKDGLARLWTDGRYFLQAGQELSADWTLMKMGVDGYPDVDDFLVSHLSKGDKVGIDAQLHTVKSATDLKEKLAYKGIELVPTSYNPIDSVWAEARPAAPKGKLRIHKTEFAGIDVITKLSQIRRQMSQQDDLAGGKSLEGPADVLLVTMLDEIMWLYNIRGSDVAYNPVAVSYAAVYMDKAVLYISSDKVDDEVQKHLLEAGVEIKAYETVQTDLEQAAASGLNVWIDPNQASISSYWAIENGLESFKRKSKASKRRRKSSDSEEANGSNAVMCIQESSPISHLKSIKNESEIKWMKEAHMRDAVALSEFWYWLETKIASGGISCEVEVDEVLLNYRKQQEGFIEPSFPTIAGADAHGAIIHYRATDTTSNKIDSNTMLLVDSGAQFDCGTTDVTRTVHFGKPTATQKNAFTRVLKGHIALDTATFPEKTPGFVLDILARQFLWKNGLDYRHGTGHGVGAGLNVHEGPQSISPKFKNETPICPGMIISNEPGYYEDNKFGVRIENLVLVEAKDTEYNFGGKIFLGFQPLTLVPMDSKLIEIDLLSKEEIEWVDRYHAVVWDTISERLEGNVKEWLYKNTRPLAEQ